ncbi:MAG: stage III sporulation protein AE [Sporanaerobacter sp.]|jgi:stage III sporulation protein AE|uniref:stage III sporulation protein AE n=1 Tax=Sporanaerobacter sp. TaxID=2010183 RepID=UPI003A0FFF19
MKNKRIAIFIMFLIIFLPLHGYGDEIKSKDENIGFIIEQFESLNLKELEETIVDLENESFRYFPKITLKEFISSIIKGERTIDSFDILQGIGKLFFNEAIENLSLLIQILAITIMCAVLTNLQTSFEKDSVGELAYYICYILITTIVIKSFATIMVLGQSTVDKMVNFMEIILPILLTLLVAVGGTITNAIFHPMVLGTVNIIGILIKDIIFPLIFFSFIVGIISRISEKVQFTKLSELMRQIVVTILGVSLTVFIGIMSVYGVASKVDGITARTAKFAVDKFIPVVGKFLSDAMDTVVGCSLILKNAVGGIGLFALFLICVFPTIQIVALIFIYKVLIVLIEPISTMRIGDSLNEVSKSLVLILVSIISVSMMFFITITIIVEAGNISMMLR